MTRTRRTSEQMPAFYTRHQQLIQVLFAVFLAGLTAGNLFVTRESSEAVTAHLSDQIQQLGQDMRAQQAVADYRLQEHDGKLSEHAGRLVALEQRRPPAPPQ